MFADRLDAIMKIAEVSNSQLGRAINVDSSYIGRLRRGQRPLPKKPEFIGALTKYTVAHITKEYQLEALANLTGLDVSKGSVSAKKLGDWLCSGEDQSINAGRARISLKKAADEDVNSCFFGIEGKRAAVIQFFEAILKESKPQTLLLFSDEDMAWMYESVEFARTWADLFKQVIMRGNKVKIVHTANRDINEMLEAIMKWVPIYLTGAVEPYVYPRIRDGLFQRTMFIAPETAAILSSSVDHNSSDMLNLFITNPQAVKAAEIEFNRFFALCKPLMEIYSPESRARFVTKSRTFSAADSNIIMSGCVPPLFAFPEAIVKEIAENTGNKGIIEAYKQSRAHFEKCMENFSWVLNLAPAEACKMHPELLSIPMSFEYELDSYKISVNQYEAVIENLVKLASEHSNLKVFFGNTSSTDVTVIVKESGGLMFCSNGIRFNAFYCEDPNLSGAFWEYLKFQMSK